MYMAIDSDLLKPSPLLLVSGPEFDTAIMLDALMGVGQHALSFDLIHTSSARVSNAELISVNVVSGAPVVAVRGSGSDGDGLNAYGLSPLGIHPLTYGTPGLRTRMRTGGA
jgi:hypothetical protein